MSIKKKIVILYHADCPDGFGAAWAAWKKFGTSAEYIPVEHQTPPPKGLYGKIIYTVDFTYLLPPTQKLIKDNVRLTSIDHHISAKNVTKKTFRFSYALNHSGSVLSWKYFHPNRSVPLLLRHIEDRDLWKFRLPGTKEVTAYLDTFRFDFKIWDALVRKFEKPATRKIWKGNGSLILEYENTMINRLIEKKAEQVRFCGYRTLAVNSPVFVSEIGNRMAKKNPPIAIIWHVRSGKLSVSLRSDGSVDVSRLAARFGGGGHKAAAGFVLPFRTSLPWKAYK